MDMRDNLKRVRELMAEVTGIEQTYGAGDNDAHALPAAINAPPAVLVFPRQLIEYIQYPGGGHRHTYQAIAQILVGGVGEDNAAYRSVPYLDAVLEKFAINVTLGGRANWIRLVLPTTWGTLEYGGLSYIGWELTFEISEQSNIAFAGGD